MLFHLRRPAVVLAALLQVLPLARTLVTHPATASAFAIILRWGIGAGAVLGSVDAVSGATSLFTTPNSFSGAVGTAFSNNVTVSIGGGNTAASADYFILSAGSVSSALLANNQSTTVTLPPGLTFTASWVNKASTIGGYISGTPTTAGTYTTSVTCVSPGNASLAQSITLTISGTTTPTAPAITSPPASATIATGKNATFTVTASGTAPLTYYWLKNSTPLASTGNISGANTATLTLTGVTATDAGNYSVLVSNAVGTATSTAAALTVIVPPAISSQPAAQTLTTGASATFAVTATGSAPLSYRWLKNSGAITNGTKFSGVSSNVLTVATIATADAGNYSVIITNLAGSVTSSIAPLTVVAAPTITTAPASASVVAGGNASFTVTAAGSTPLFYQWLKGNAPLADGGNVSGATTATLNLSAVGSGDAAAYSVTVSNSLGSVTSAAATLTVAIPPAITTSPVGATIVAGSNITFTVTASGTAPLSYQWLKNGTPISGATTATLTLTKVTATDAANYSATVTNAVGSATSASATLIVLVAPAITSPPANATITQGNPASFTVTATGTAPLTYQWLKNGAPIAGATSNVFTISAVTTNDAASYSVVVTNIVSSIASSSATLTVLVPPTITTQPANATAIGGSNVSFTVSASGSGTLTYQWLKNGVVIGSATSATLTLANVGAGDAASYSVIVGNAVTSITSLPVTLTVLIAPAITSPPANATITQGNQATFTVTAMGTAPLAYQWLKNGAPISGATSNVFTISAVTTNDAANYSVVVTNIVGSLASSSATLTVLVPPTITTQPTSATAIAGSNVSFTVAATGSGTLTYQWLKNGVAIGSATSATLTLANVGAGDAASYSVIVGNAATSITSSAATLTVLIAPAVIAQPANAGVVQGNSASFTVTATGTAPLTYQWLKNGAPIAGATSNVFTISAVTTNDAASYSVVVTNIVSSIASSSATLTVLVPPTITTQPADTSVIAGNSAAFTITATGANPLSYQWRKNGTNIAGATAATLTLASVTTADAANYSVVVSNSAGSATSVSAVLTVQLPPTIVTPPASQFGALGSTINLSVTASGTGPLSYQWFKGGSALTDGGNISGATTSTLTITGLTTNETSTFFVVVSNAFGSATSANASISVNVSPIITSQPASQYAGVGSNALFNVTVAGTGPFTYQWLKNKAKLGNNATISGTTSSSLKLTKVAATASASYSVVIKNTYGSVTSSIATLAVLNPPRITATTRILKLQANRQVKAGTNITFTITATGSAPLSYQWFRNGAALPNGGTVSGATTNTLTLKSVTTTDSGIYYVVVSNPVGSATSANAALTVFLLPAITDQPASQSAIVGDAISFTPGVNGTAPLHYQWFKNTKSIAGATNLGYSLPSVQTNDNGAYYVVVTNFAGSVTSAVATLTVWVAPVFTTQAASQTGTNGAAIVLSATVNGTAPFSFHWFKNGVALQDIKNITGAFSSALTIANLTTNDNGAYTLTVSNYAGSITSSNAVLTVKRKKISDNVLASAAPGLPPVIAQIVRNADGSVTLNCSGTAGVNYTAQASTDLTTWTNIATNVADATGQLQVTDAAAATLPARFYRLATP